MTIEPGDYLVGSSTTEQLEGPVQLDRGCRAAAAMTPLQIDACRQGLQTAKRPAPALSLDRS